MSQSLLHPDEALSLVLAAGHRCPRRLDRVPLAEALGRLLPTALIATVDQPPFDKAAMDGFAFDPDRPAEIYRVDEVIAAGGTPGETGRSHDASSDSSLGRAARIMTGAPLPPGTSAVQRFEWTEAAGRGPDGAALVRFTAPETLSNVIRRGENLRSGEVLLGPRILAAQDLGILASSGYAEVEVARRQVVGVLSTGNELREPGSPLGPASIYDSNGPSLTALARAGGAEAHFYGLVPDEEAALRHILSRALEDCDVVMLSGGVSMGDFDYVPRVLEALGVERIFHRIAMKPGKPTFFGMRGDTAVFGLPGNPVSTFVNFEVLVRPHLYARMGFAYTSRLLPVRLAQPIVRRETDRVEFFPARLEAGPAGALARPLRYHGSSMLSVLAEADLLIRVEIGTGRVDEGEMVDARLVRP